MPCRNFRSAARRLAGPATLERGGVSASRRLKAVCRGNVALVGDASGSVDAITGEGLCLLFQQAVALAGALEAGDLALYQAEHRRIGRRPEFMADVMLLMDHRTRLRRRALRTMASHPRLFAAHAGHARRRVFRAGFPDQWPGLRLAHVDPMMKSLRFLLPLACAAAASGRRYDSGAGNGPADRSGANHRGIHPGRRAPHGARDLPAEAREHPFRPGHRQGFGRTGGGRRQRRRAAAARATTACTPTSSKAAATRKSYSGPTACRARCLPEGAVAGATSRDVRHPRRRARGDHPAGSGGRRTGSSPPRGASWCPT